MEKWAKEMSSGLVIKGQGSTDKKKEFLMQALLQNERIVPSEVCVFDEEVKIEKAREILRKASCYPSYKHIFVLMEGATMAAYNALLKCVEESDTARFVFFTQNAGNIPATIVSRCQAVSVEADRLEDFAEYGKYAEAYFLATGGDCLKAKTECFKELPIKEYADAIQSGELGKVLAKECFFYEKTEYGKERLRVLARMVIGDAWKRFEPRKAAILDELFCEKQYDVVLYLYLGFVIGGAA